MNIGDPDKPVAVIAGATATGKSALAIAVAQALGGVIINADATQLYADLRILSARPDETDLNAAPHRLYGVIDGADACSAAGWAAMARSEIDAAHGSGRLPILVGGTGLYLRTLIDGIAPVPEIDPQIREAVRGLDTMAARDALLIEDPDAAARLQPADRQRSLRALEVVRSTGRTLAGWQAEQVGGIGATCRIAAVVIDREREALRQRCTVRVDEMFARGAVAEVERLLSRRLPADSPVLRAIGMPPIAAFLAGTLTHATAVATVAHDTRRYAKRQATWFRNQTSQWPQYNGELTNLNEKVSEYFTGSFRR